jgi:hypothetical protein
MRKNLICFPVLVALSILMTADGLFTQDRAVLNSADSSLNALPLTFEPNQGQVDANVRFLARGSSYAILLEGNKTVLVIPRDKSPHESAQEKPSVVTLELLNSDRQATSEGLNVLPGKSNYFVGNQRAKWIAGIPQYGQVKFRSVYPGIDLVYYGGESGLEYDFLLSAGADPREVVFRVMGADKVELDDSGNLSLRVAGGQIDLRRPTIYQEIGGIRHEVPGRFILRSTDEVGFSIGDYDHSRALVVDPVLSYSTLVGANNSTQVQGVAVDSAGEIFVTGTTFATNYPVVKPFQSTNKGTTNVFVTKLNAAGNAILYSTYIGSNGFDTGRAIAVDSSGNAYLTGNIGGANFPTTPGAFMTTCTGTCNTPFVSKFLSDGSLAFSTFMGGSNVGASAIAVDSAGEAYITGTAASSDLPTTPGCFEPNDPGLLCTSCNNGYIEKLNASGTALVYSTYFGAVSGNGFPPSTAGSGIAVDSAGNAYLVGNTTGIPVKNAIQSSVVGGPNAFIAKFSPDGSSLVFSTYLGGSSAYFFSYAGDFATGVAVDQLGNVHVVGTSSSCEFPLTLNAWSTDCVNGGYTQKVFVSTLKPSGTQLLFSTFLENGFSEGIAVDLNGNTYVTGIATSNNLPLLHAIENNPQAGASAPFGSNSFITELDLSGKILFSTYLGQSGGGAQTAGIAVDSKGGIYVAGAGQGDFPLLHPIPSQILQSTYYTAFLAKISPANVPQFSLSPRVSPILALRNVSSVPLTISSIIPSVNFTKEGDCETTLAPGTGCTLILVGKADNKTSGMVTIASNASTSPQSFVIYKSPTGDSVGASLSIYPQFVQFPPQLIGSTSAPQKVLITNAGPLPAAIDSIFLIQPAAFTEINDCLGLLEPFSYCTVTVTYNAATANDSAQLGILHDPNQTQDTVFLSGFGSNSAILASTPSVSFGTQYVGATPLARIVNFTNTSTYPAAIPGLTTSPGFAQVNTCTAPLAPQAECRVAVSYIPATNESPTGQLTASNLGPGGPQAVTLYGTGLIRSDLAASPLPLDLYANVGQPTSATVTLTNTSTTAMTLTAFQVSSGFTQSNNCNGGLAAGASCTLTVKFAPTQAGTFNGTVSITHTGVGSPQVVPVVGTARTIFYLNPAPVTYGQVRVRTPLLGYLGLANNGGSSVTVKSITVQGTDFKLTKNGCPTVIPPFYGCDNVEITFTPSATGVRTGTATVVVSDSTTPLVDPLQGIGVSAGVGTLSTGTLTFAEQSIGTTSAARTLTLKNAGTGVLTLGTISASTQFVQTKTCTATLAAGAACTISVRFAPTLPGILEGTLTVQDDGAGSPHTVALSGIGR